MFNVLIGPSGSGKSYEAVVFHVLVQLARGRKVITNLPLVLEEFEKIDASYVDLIEFRRKPLPIKGTWNPTDEEGAYKVLPEERWIEPEPDARVFAGVWDYYDTWRHPTKKFGAFFAVDEAQYSIPFGATAKEVEEWNALHRHFNQDGIYITQSYGKLSKNITANVQVMYRCRKNVALGAPKSYTRKVQDGVRGEVMNTAIRSYDSKFFKLYRSHTQGEAASELSADDVKPLWKHWSFIGAGICVALLVVGLASGKLTLNPMKASEKTDAQLKQVAERKRLDLARAQAAPVPGAAVPALAASQSAVSRPASAPHAEVKPEDDPDPEPYAGRGVHLVGVIERAGRSVYAFLVSQNGQGQFTVTDADLARSGYTWKPLGICTGRLIWNGKPRTVICDVPPISMQPATPKART